MSSRIDRRRFLEIGGSVALGAGLGGAALARAAEKLTGGAPHAEKLGWRLSIQAWSFNHYSFYEAIEKTSLLNLRYIEAFPGQKVAADQPDVKMGPDTAPRTRKAIKKQLANAGVKLVNFGVCSLAKDAGQSRKTFDFAADMGIETLVSEPEFDALDSLEKLCDEYKINLALHNHPKGHSRYWNPDIVLDVCKGRSKRIGACADTGHWVRSGLNPIQQLKKLEGRIISLHFKDLNKYGEGAHDVPWGTGVSDVDGMLAELHRQQLKAVFSIEYEYNWTGSVPEIAQCVTYFDKVAAKLGG